ncbi:MAG: circadian clock KaiB family protein [Syntrophorhabdaceae bacterium]
MKDKTANSTADFEKALSEKHKISRYILRLYVTGLTPKSRQAILNVKRICEEHLKGHYELEVIDISQQPVLAQGEQIIATPTLIKKLPSPLRRFIGDMADTDRILLGLDLVAKEDEFQDPDKRSTDEKEDT